MSKEYEQHLVSLWTKGDSRHTRTNVLHLHRAIGQFIRDARFAWLCSDPVSGGNPNGTLRCVILTELGRIADEQVRETMALELCARKPLTRTAVAWIRAYRLGKHPEGSVQQLSRAFARTLQDYLVAHPEMPWDAVQEAVDRLSAWVDTAAEQEETVTDEDN